MDTSKPKSSKDDDVILYMDELPSDSGLRRSTTMSSDTNDDKHKSEYDTLASTLMASTNGTSTNSKLETETNDPSSEYGPEIDDLGPEARRLTNHDYYPENGTSNDGAFDNATVYGEDEKHWTSSIAPRHRGEEFPTYPGFSSTVSPTPDMNVYQQKKTIAQGMMDLALISANANQFRYVLQSSGRHPYYYPSLVMIGLSLLLQVVVGIGLIWNSRYNVKLDDQMCKANRANNWTVIAVFLVTILNVFISSFGVIETSEILFSDNMLSKGS